jgi:SAM-dependent methyltransferase
MLPGLLRRNPLWRRLAALTFPVSGHRYPSPWYTPYKFRQLARVLASQFDPQQLPAGYGRWLDERIVEYPWLFSRLRHGPGRLLDAGSVLNFASLLRHPILQDKELTIMTLAPEEDCFWRRGLSYVYGDLRSIPFRDEYFDQIVCISTLEHIGLDNTLLYTADETKNENAPESHLVALREMRRVLRPEGSLFLTVPFGQREIRSWIQIFDSFAIDRILETLAAREVRELYFRYHAEQGWRLSSREDAADARYFDFRTDLPWPGRPVAAEAVACLELQKRSKE